MFYSFLNKKISFHNTSNRVLNSEIIQPVFDEFFCNPERFPFETINLDGYKCFIKIFKALNS
jgi:hypothetical protein